MRESSQEEPNDRVKGLLKIQDNDAVADFPLSREVRGARCSSHWPLRIAVVCYAAQNAGSERSAPRVF